MDDRAYKKWDLRFRCETMALFHQRLACWHCPTCNCVLLTALLAIAVYFVKIPASFDAIFWSLIWVSVNALLIVKIVKRKSDRVNFCAQQSEKYASLCTKIDLPEANLAQIKYAYYVLEADEVYGPRKNLLALCGNEVCYRHSGEVDSSWYRNAYIELKWYRRIWPLPYLFDFGSEAPKPKPALPSGKVRVEA